jgi:hypothetical protein
MYVNITINPFTKLIYGKKKEKNKKSIIKKSGKSLNVCK